MLKWCIPVSFSGGPTSLGDPAQGEAQTTTHRASHVSSRAICGSLTTSHQEKKKKKGPSSWRSLQSSFNILREWELTARFSAAEEGSTLDQQEKHR